MGTVVRSAGEHNRYQVIHFLVDLVRLRILTCPRLPVLISRREVTDSIIQFLLDDGMTLLEERDARAGNEWDCVL